MAFNSTKMAVGGDPNCSGLDGAAAANSQDVGSDHFLIVFSHNAAINGRHIITLRKNGLSPVSL